MVNIIMLKINRLVSFILIWFSFSSVLQAQTEEQLYQAFEFRNIGPTRGGRVTTVAGIADQPGTFYQGATGGGVWKTTDYGITWSNVSDGYFATPSIGAIRVVQSNPDIVYVGTGSDGLRSNVITGKGVYKSIDAGKSWSHIGLMQTGQIGAVEIHPDDPNTVFVAAIGQAFQKNEERGVYKTSDGGESWKKVLYHSDSVGAVDIEFAPGNPNILYATLWRGERKPWTIISGCDQCGGVYKSTDGGETWSKKSSGLPQGLIGKADLAVSAADPNRVYVVVEAPEKQGGLYRSDDQAETFTQVSDNKDLVNRPFYYTNVDANPLNADIVYSFANPAVRSNDAGKTWKKFEAPHGDHHDIWINPKDTSIYIQSNDGGANISTNSGATWSSQHNQSTAELYQIEVDDQYPFWVYSGQQDNTTIAVPILPPYGHPGGGTGFWMATGGCETGPAVPKPGNHNVVYSDCKGRFGVFDKRTGQEKQYYVGAANIYGHNPKDLKFRFQRVAPVHVSQHNPDVVYHTSQYVHKTTDDGVTWQTISPDLTAFEADKQVVPGTPITRDVTGEEYYSTIYAIRESPLKEGLIWVGANDGPIHVTQNGGTNWKNVTPNMPKGGRVDCVEPSPHREGKAYAAVLRYQLGDWKPYIYKTMDYGASWSLLTNGSNGIPSDYPTRVVREDPNVEGLLYAGTEFGLFISHDDGQSWKPFNQNLPVTPVTDIRAYRQTLVMSTMGRGFWVLDNLSSIQQVDRVAGKDTYLFKPQNTHLLRYSHRPRVEEPIPDYPKMSLPIDYYLKNEIDGEVTLEILDDSGKVISSFTSAEKPKKDEGTTDMATGFFDEGGRSGLTKKVGTNRFRWDLQHQGAWAKKNPYSNGPLVKPGKYSARLNVNGNSQTQEFELLMNPNLMHAGVTMDHLNKQEMLALQVRDLLDASRKIGAEIEDLLKVLKEDKSSKAKKTTSSLKTIKSELVTSEGIYMTPMLIDQTRYLGSMLNRADQVPGKDAYDRYAELKAKFDDLKSQYSKIK
ncbi:MAG: hypothetical protein RJQ09_16370 [Cyclobacteriaceae bacterium]